MLKLLQTRRPSVGLSMPRRVIYLMSCSVFISIPLHSSMYVSMEYLYSRPVITCQLLLFDLLYIYSYILSIK